MRLCLLLLASTTLAACGGAGVETAGSVATPSSAGGGTTGGGGTASTHSFVNPSEVKTYAGIGAAHSYKYTTNNIDGDPSTPAIDPSSVQYNQLYAGDASTARNSGISITYNPRDAIFDLTINQPLANVNQTTRFQDPAHRTNFGGALEPQGGVPDITSQGVNFLQVGSGAGTPVYDASQSTTFPIGTKDTTITRSTFFYQKPGTSTRYVTFAGFVRNSVAIAQISPAVGAPYLENNFVLERAAFAYGERTANAGVPTTGTGTYSGAMLATMVYNPLLDTDPGAPTYFQWISGTSSTAVNFANSSFTLALNGTVFSPLFDTYTSRVFTLQNGATFAANGTGRIDLVNAGGFLGSFQTARFTQPGGTVLNVNIAGSSIDGAFFGPAADEVGGGFRIVGGTPDERIDILGAFTGKK